MQHEARGCPAVEFVCRPMDENFLPPSLLDVRDSRGEDEIITRTLCAAMRSPDCTAADIQDAISACVEQTESPLEFTGLVLIQETTVLCLVETESAAVLRFLAVLDQLQKHPRLACGPWVVLANAEDCRQRRFDRLYVNEVSLTVEPEVSLEGENMVDLCYTMYSNLLQLRAKLHEEGGEFSRAKRKFPHLLPSNSRVAALAKSKAVTTVREHVEANTGPVDIVLGTELVWPHAPRVAY